ncbi:uncharacterized protein LOC116263134 [Nymphaea colorata]|nr:uncharacterized protein LOC116263134 [Nymphaea colorata]XP_031498599.1 uncharacterized protein LOC116263134 [Nymphaea colorata]
MMNKGTTSSSTVSLSRVSEETAGRAVDSLLKWVIARPKYQKAQLFDHDEFLYLILTLKRIPASPRMRPFKIPLPNPLFPFDGSLEICLIIDDRPKSLNSKEAKQKIEEEGIPISKVLKFSKLKTDYRAFEARRKLCGSYDLFFADKRIIPLLPRLLGKSFFRKKKIPLPVELTHKNWKEQMQCACNSTFFFLRMGTCSVLKVGKVSQKREEIIANVMAATQGIVDVIPKKWDNVRSFHLKTLESLALPIYQVLPENGLKIDTGIEKVQPHSIEKESTKEVTESRKEKEKKQSKKGRIHEVQYMNSILGEPDAGSSDDDVGPGDSDNNDDGLHPFVSDVGKLAEKKEKMKKMKVTSGTSDKKSPKKLKALGQGKMKGTKKQKKGVKA